MARTHDMDRKHMMDVLRRAHFHKGAAFVEVYQNCNVFNDGAFEGVTAKEARSEMLIELHDGEPIRFGADGRARRDPQRVRRVRDRGGRRRRRREAHGARRDVATARRSRSRSHASRRRPRCPRRSACSATIERPTYEIEVQRQVVAAVERQGPGDLAALIGSGATWEVN